MGLRNTQCLDRFVTVWGWVFDVLLIVINITDVVSDCLVAREFWINGHKQFFWLVIASLLLANVIYTIFGVEVVCRETLRWRHPRVLQYIVVFPFAQLMPVVNWAVEHIKPSSTQWAVLRRRTTSSTQWAVNLMQGSAGAVEEEAAAIAASSKIMERLDKALAVHLRTHLLFYVESLVEAIPQSICQLLAVTFLDSASPLQVFSLSLSMLSIISKGYVLSRSFSIPQMVWKFMLGAHDLFSLFYIFSTVISSRAPKQVHLVGSLYVDYFTAAWGVKVGVDVFMGLVAALIIFAWLIYEQRGNLCRCRTIGQGVLIVFFASLAAVPVIIAGEGLKLLWLNGLVTAFFEPRPRVYPPMAMLHSFVTRGDYTERMRYVAGRVCELEETEEHPAAWVGRMRRVLATSPFTTKELHRGIFTDAFSLRLPTNPRDRLLVVLITIGMTIYGIGQVYALLFPFLSFGINYDHQNLLQLFCFYATAGSFLIVLLLTPSTYWYVWFALETKYLLRVVSDTETLQRFIQDYHVPPHEFILRQMIPTKLLPTDIIRIVAGQLGPSDIDLSTLNIKQCQEIKERMIVPLTADDAAAVTIIRQSSGVVEDDGKEEVQFSRQLTDVEPD